MYPLSSLEIMFPSARSLISCILCPGELQLKVEFKITYMKKYYFYQVFLYVWIIYISLSFQYFLIKGSNFL